MNDDDVLTRLGELERDARREDELFERVARGDASPEELAELERRAAADPALATRLEGSRPLDAKAVDRIVARVGVPAPTARAAGAPGVIALQTRSPAAKSAPARGDAAPSGARARDWRRKVVVAAGPLALAAAMIVYVSTQRGPGLPELPAYTVTATGQSEVRGPADDGSSRLRLAKDAARDARFEVLLRPATAPPGKVVAYAFTSGPSATEPTPLDAKIELAPEGAVRLSGTARALAGAHELRLVVGAPEAIGRFDDAAARAASGKSDAHVKVLVVPIDRE